MLLILIGTVALGIFVVADAEHRLVLGPLLSVVGLSAALVLWLYGREGAFPLFDVGVVCALATTLYIAIPLLNFIAGGLEFTALSDSRLQLHSPDPYEVGSFHWRHVLYLASFVTCYVLVRRRAPRVLPTLRAAPWPIGHHVVVLYLLLAAFFVVLFLTTGYGLNESYESVHAQFRWGGGESLPTVVVQVAHRMAGIMVFLKFAVFLLMMRRWHMPEWRFVIFAWIAVEIVYAVTVLGARSNLMFLLGAVLLLFHRVVRPLSLPGAVSVASLLLAAFLAYGYARDLASSEVGSGESLLSARNEFQSLLGTAYDVHKRVLLQTPEIPWQVYLNDVVKLLPPHQLLPFPKFTASEWYLRLIGVEGLGVGYMWGVISQAAVGFDWWELVVRGAVLGLLLGAVHLWYTRRAESFLATVCYLWLCIRIYYSYRDTTLAPFVLFIYEVVPALIVLRILSPRDVKLFHSAPNPTVTHPYGNSEPVPGAR